MHLSLFTNTLFLCVINVAFMIAGIFLNSVVIVSLWRSSQLRRKPCYFMIIVLSCLDLVGVIIVHPLQILSAIRLYFEVFNELYEHIRIFICVFLHGFSMLALLTLNIERFLGLSYPIFHRRSVNKERLLYLLGFMMILHSAQTVLSTLIPKILVHVLTMVYPFVFLFLFGYFNYKMFIITTSNRKNERSIGPSPNNQDQETKRHVKINFRKIGTCSLAVFCFFICSFPQVIYSCFRLTSDRPFHDRPVLSFNIWSITFISMNSTFNCLIFFWRNLILRREGIKIIKNFWVARF